MRGGADISVGTECGDAAAACEASTSVGEETGRDENARCRAGVSAGVGGTGRSGVRCSIDEGGCAAVWSLPD